MSDEELLPPPAERAFLVAALAEVVRAGGFSRLVTAPIAEPTPTYFPDRWAGGQASFGRLALRLLHYAGLDDLAVRAEVFPADARQGPPPAPPASGGVWLEGLSGGMCTVMAQADALREPLDVVAATARAVADAWRRKHALGGEDPRDTQRRIDVTTVYLGFGLLTASASLRFFARAGADLRLRPSTSRLGALPPQGMSYLLAIQAVVRELDARERRRLAGGLPPNQAAFFRAALDELDPRRAELSSALGVPARDTWPPPPDLAELTAPLDDEVTEDAPEERAGQDRGVVGLNAGKPVFRVEQKASARLANVLVMATLMLGGLVARSVKGIDLSVPQLLAAGIGLAGIGWLVGRMFEDVRCSEPKCGARLTRDQKTCPRCGGTISGVIKHARDRLAAEEALARRGSTEVASPGAGEAPAEPDR